MYSIERRTVSTAIIWNPLTWRSTREETRVHFYMDAPIKPGKELEAFIQNNANEYTEWESTSKGKI